MYQIKYIIAKDCKSSTGDDLTLTPDFWCDVKANISLSKLGCFIEVEEILQIPWSPGFIKRAVPHQHDQELYDVSAFLNKDGKQVALNTSAKKTSAKIRTDIRISMPSSPFSITIRVNYKVVFGIMRFVHCPSLGPFNDSSNTLGGEILFARWAMGAFSVRNVHIMTVTFILTKNDQRTYIDSKSLHPSDSEVKQAIISNNNEEITTQFLVNSEKLYAGELIFYIRVSSKKSKVCDIARSCTVENGFLSERIGKNPKKTSFIVLIVLGVIGGMALILILVWIIWCRKSATTELSETPDGSLPPSFAHFSYDRTQDDLPERGQRWREWTKGGGLTPAASGQAVLATELSKGASVIIDNSNE